jgi:hypothetical protein
VLEEVEASPQLILVVVLDKNLQVLNDNSAQDIVEELGDLREAVQNPQDLRSRLSCGSSPCFFRQPGVIRGKQGLCKDTDVQI